MSRTGTLLLFLLLWATALFAQDNPSDARYPLPRRVMPLEKALMKLTEAGAEIVYRPDQIPDLALRVPGGRRTIEGWLGFLLRDTELKYEQLSTGFLVLPDPDLLSREFSVYGVVTDATSGERLIGAALRQPDTETGALANEYGFYTLGIRGGRRILRASYIGYTTQEIDLVLRSDTLINIALRPDSELPPIIVTAVSDTAQSLFLTESGIRIGRKEVSLLGGPGGEADPLRMARLLPGVTSGADGVGGLFIRGGEAGHNLVLLDGVPVYNLSHAAGLFSIFSNEAIRRIDLYKDAIPARFGGRIGGVLDVHTRDGNLYEPEINVGSSLLAAKFSGEGPIEEGKSSFLITGRYFWARELLRRFSRVYKENNGRDGETDYQVYDVNFKLNQQINDRSRIYFSFYKGLDDYTNLTDQTDTVTVLNDLGAVFRYGNPQHRSEDVSWGNTVAALRYNYVFNDRLFGNFRLSYSDLRVRATFETSDSLNEVRSEAKSGEIFSGRYASDIKQIGLAFDGQYGRSGGAQLRFGVSLDAHRFLPRLNSGAIPLSRHEEVESFGSNSGMHRPVQLATYASYRGEYKSIAYRFGLRAQVWRNRRNYYHLMPRLLVAGKLNAKTNWRISYDQTVQPIHLISSTIISLPSDLWIPSTSLIVPATSEQFSVQLTRRLSPGLQLELGAYHRDMKGLVDFDEGGAANGSWEENVSVGDGFANGIELTLRRSTGKIRGWFNYTLAQSRREFEDLQINLGRPFPFRYDRRHSFNAIMMWQLSPRTTATVSWRFGTGAAFSLSTQSVLLPNPAEEDLSEIPIDVFRERNGFRLPANHRLDVNVQTVIANDTKKGMVHTLNFGVYNLYNRKNPIYYDIRTQYYSRDGTILPNRNFVQVYIAPMLPTFSYQLKFNPKTRK
ncbi:carboxypeptidase-like regulatory domain-containing protein [Lewinella sp. W8]|uniref:TonB-dependent receptor n=1 Tax=Lewinella sp. W8 TaxID=2528208 RepID=UPI0010675947|nr:carboxypeptidase-like regulatory domain-containing protein [Lewinella sp. W8]MTB51357.1 TonB-dependent receptor plug domain-containing protein [Lewinella sp. W8]